MNKKILFVTGTRADYGKIKSLIHKVEEADSLEAYVYVSGMHLLPQYGNTYKEVLKDGFHNVQVAFGQRYTSSMSHNLGDVICNLSAYVESIQPNMILVHGDRIDALAGAIVGALNNILVAHIEGGEISGTIDDSIRHAITKFAHLHFVCTEEAANRLQQLGENPTNIYVIGSPDIDIMLADNQPSLADVKKYYEINFDEYAMCMYHPVTTESEQVGEHVEQLVDAMIDSGQNYIVVYPNNDTGTEVIMNEYKRIKDNPRFAVFPSLRFEYFLVLLKNASFVLGNSSAGVRETGIYGIPAIDVGTRQEGRYRIEMLPNIQHTNETEGEILDAIGKIEECRVCNQVFGDGDSTERFMAIIQQPETWKRKIQKKFIDYKGTL